MYMKNSKGTTYKRIVTSLSLVLIIAITAILDFSDWAGGLFFMILCCIVHIIVPIVFYCIFKDDEKCTRKTILYSLIAALVFYGTLFFKTPENIEYTILNIKEDKQIKEIKENNVDNTFIYSNGGYSIYLENDSKKLYVIHESKGWDFSGFEVSLNYRLNTFYLTLLENSDDKIRGNVLVSKMVDDNISFIVYEGWEAASSFDCFFIITIDNDSYVTGMYKYIFGGMFQ